MVNGGHEHRVAAADRGHSGAAEPGRQAAVVPFGADVRAGADDREHSRRGDQVQEPAQVQTAREVLAGPRPERVLYEAVKRMVPRTKLGRQQMTKLKIYAGPNHPHQAQQPVAFQLVP